MNYFFPILVIFTLIFCVFKKTRRVSIILLLFIFLSLITIYPNISLSAASDGINLWIFVVMPSLFPFFIISDLLIALKIPENIARLFAPIARFLFNTSGYGAYVFIMSIFSGYPSGAKITRELIEANKITDAEGQKILSFSSTSGPLFIIGAVGAGMLKSTHAGYIIFICHVLGAIVNGILLNFFTKRNSTLKEVSNKTHTLYNNSSPGNLMSSAIANSLYTSGFIGGYIILFSVIIALLDKIAFFSVITNIIGIAIPSSVSWLLGIVAKTSLEISNGCKIISSLSCQYELKLILCSFIIAFSGFSIIGQVGSIINKTKINLKAYILYKLNHGVISSALCYLLLKINLFNITTSNQEHFSIVNYNIFLLLFLLVIILLFNILGIIKNNHNK